MGKRGRKSNAEVLVGVVARMPWWACLGMALASFLFFRAMSAPPKVVAVHTSQVGQLMAASMVSSLAMAAQYVAPIICLVAAVVSFARRRKRVELVATAAATGIDSGPGSIAGMTWREFELLVGEAFRLQSYQVVETGGGGADGGVDLRLRRGKETFLVQCKQWRATQVGVDVVRELYGVMAAEGAGRLRSDLWPIYPGRPGVLFRPEHQACRWKAALRADSAGTCFHGRGRFCGPADKGSGHGAGSGPSPVLPQL